MSVGVHSGHKVFVTGDAGLLGSNLLGDSGNAEKITPFGERNPSSVLRILR